MISFINNYKKLLAMDFGCFLGFTLYGIGHYLIFGQTNIVELAKYTIFSIVVSSIVFLIASKTQFR